MDPREKEAKFKKGRERQALLDRAYDRVVGSQLDKLSKKQDTTGRYSIQVWYLFVCLF